MNGPLSRETIRRRPLRVATLEDKVMQRAAVEALNAIYAAPPALAAGDARGPDSGPLR